MFFLILTLDMPFAAIFFYEKIFSCKKKPWKIASAIFICIFYSSND